MEDRSLPANVKKRCNSCLEIKPEADFYYKKSAGRFMARCKVCELKRQKSKRFDDYRSGRCAFCGKPGDRIETRPSGDEGQDEKWAFCSVCWIQMLDLRRPRKENRSYGVSRLYALGDDQYKESKKR